MVMPNPYQEQPVVVKVFCNATMISNPMPHNRIYLIPQESCSNAERAVLEIYKDIKPCCDW